MNQITEDVFEQSKRSHKKERKNDNLKKKKGKLKKLLVLLAIFIMNGLGFMNAVYATSIDSANLYAVGDCGSLLKYKGAVVKVSYIQYSNNGMDYPAYCMDKTKPGAETGSYTVSIQEAIKDVGLWRRVINGYPYKTLEELGVASKEEAFTATKQAIYCYIHGNNPQDYEGIGEAGQRTLQAMNRIINHANNSQETKISSTLQIRNLENEWKQDEMDKQYASKVFEVKANGTIKNYSIQITKENAPNMGGIKLTDMQNKEKSLFAPNEKFKVLVPLKNMTETGAFKLTVEGEVQTKPVLYGRAPNSNYQDYALTALTYEDGTGEKSDEYPKNETEIIILKKDEKTKEKLENTEFQLLDENKKVVYADLKTDKEGKIQIKHLIPGKYYIKETKAKEGYELYDQLIELQVSLHEQYTVTIHNNKQEKPKIEINKKVKNKEVSAMTTTRKILPVTGM